MAAEFRIGDELLQRLYDAAKADRWRLSRGAFACSLESSCRKAFPGDHPGLREIARYTSALRLEDLALATACAEGHADAWDHFVLEYRPHLYRVADALDPSGGARELADSLYGELYGVDERGEACQSLLRYFHGRSSLRTWLRAVLSQRYVDRIRAESRRTELPEELPDEAGSAPADLECVEYVELLGMALAAAVDRLEPRDRMRLACYYLQRLTLAETGRLLHEHEGTVSRQLARTRKMVRARAEVHLKDKGLTEAQIIRAFECASQDVGAMSLEEMFGSRKVLEPDRSL